MIRAGPVRWRWVLIAAILGALWLATGPAVCAATQVHS
jgi:hypothetical protein